MLKSLFLSIVFVAFLTNLHGQTAASTSSADSVSTSKMANGSEKNAPAIFWVEHDKPVERPVVTPTAIKNEGEEEPKEEKKSPK